MAKAFGVSVDFCDKYVVCLVLLGCTEPIFLFFSQGGVSFHRCWASSRKD
jgi:hypothetical protein